MTFIVPVPESEIVVVYPTNELATTTVLVTPVAMVTPVLQAMIAFPVRIESALEFTLIPVPIPALLLKIELPVTVVDPLPVAALM